MEPAYALENQKVDLLFVMSLSWEDIEDQIAKFDQMFGNKVDDGQESTW